MECRGRSIHERVHNNMASLTFGILFQCGGGAARAEKRGSGRVSCVP